MMKPPRRAGAGLGRKWAVLIPLVGENRQGRVYEESFPLP